MGWVRIDDQVPRNAKILRAGPAASWLWVCGIAHCQAQLTDGFIAEEVLPLIGVVGRARAIRLAAQLVTVGLFERVDGGYRIHDYHDHNWTKEEAIEHGAHLSNVRAAAGRKGGLAKAGKLANGWQPVLAKSSPIQSNGNIPPIAPHGGRARRKNRGYRVEGRTCQHAPRCESFAACTARTVQEAKDSKAS